MLCLTSFNFQVFPGMSVEDIVKNEVKVHNFSYPLIKIQKLKVYFKIKPGQRQMCLRIEFYQDPGKCGNCPFCLFVCVCARFHNNNRHSL